MPTIDFNGRSLAVNEEGFLVNPEDWSPELAAFMAKKDEGIEQMNDKHWTVIHFIRQYYQEHNIAPMVRVVCKKTNLKLQEIYELFPSGPAKGAAKLAGLLKPDGCV